MKNLDWGEMDLTLYNKPRLHMRNKRKIAIGTKLSFSLQVCSHIPFPGQMQNEEAGQVQIEREEIHL